MIQYPYNETRNKQKIGEGNNMKAGFYVWIDRQERKVRISTEYEMIEQFDARYNNRPYPHKWNVDLFEYQDFAEAKNAQVEIADGLKIGKKPVLDADSWENPVPPVSLYEHCKEESGLTNHADILRYMNRFYGLN
jgi:hypothetical protein